MSGDLSNSSGGNRLPRRLILRGKDAFARMFSSSSRISGRHVDLRYRLLPIPSSDIQAGFVAGRRVGNAVRRNYGKRVMREIYRTQQHLLDPVVAETGTSLHLIFILKNPQARHADLLLEIPDMLHRLVRQASAQSSAKVK